MLKLPAALVEAISGYKRRRNHTGMSASRVYRLERASGENLYLKITARPHSELREEKLVLEWLGGKLLVPKVIMFESDAKRDYLLISEIEGVPASDECFHAAPQKTIEQLAKAMKAIHALPIVNCPFDATLDVKIELARRNVELKLVDESDFDEERQGRTAVDLFRELVATKPKHEDLVFTHGDFCLPNIILKNGRVSGFIDLGRAGIADRYQDIALLYRSVKYNFGAKWQPFLFETLEIEPDFEKIEFYTLLDEFF
jgi:aminoglycoside phosphotransferase